MGQGAFGRDRHVEPGDWVQFSGLTVVAGVQHRRDQVERYCRLVAAAQRAGLRYGVELEAEPTNPHDRNAIRVIGKVASKPLFGSVRAERFHIGYLPADLAREVTSELTSQGLSFAGELYSIYVSDGGFTDIKIFVLGPPGHSHSARLKRLKSKD